MNMDRMLNWFSRAFTNDAHSKENYHNALIDCDGLIPEGQNLAGKPQLGKAIT